MNKYIAFIKDSDSKVIEEVLVTPFLIHEMKRKGFRKHHIIVEAENEKEAVKLINESCEGYLDSLKELSGSAVICAVCVIIVAVIYLLGS